MVKQLQDLSFESLVTTVPDTVSSHRSGLAISRMNLSGSSIESIYCAAVQTLSLECMRSSNMCEDRNSAKNMVTADNKFDNTVDSVDATNVAEAGKTALPSQVVTKMVSDTAKLFLRFVEQMKSISRVGVDLEEVTSLFITIYVVIEASLEHSSVVIDGVNYPLSDYEICSQFSSFIPVRNVKWDVANFLQPNAAVNVSGVPLTPYQFKALQYEIAGAFKVQPSFTKLVDAARDVEIASSSGLILWNGTNVHCVDVSGTKALPTMLIDFPSKWLKSDYFNTPVSAVETAVAYNLALSFRSSGK